MGYLIYVAKYCFLFSDLVILSVRHLLILRFLLLMGSDIYNYSVV